MNEQKDDGHCDFCYMCPLRMWLPYCSDLKQSRHMPCKGKTEFKKCFQDIKEKRRVFDTGVPIKERKFGQRGLFDCRVSAQESAGCGWNK